MTPRYRTAFAAPSGFVTSTPRIALPAAAKPVVVASRTGATLGRPPSKSARETQVGEQVSSRAA